MDDKKKANGRKCVECNRPLVGRQMKNCGQACAQRQYEKRKGIKPPNFVETKLKESSINGEKKLQQIQQNPSSIQFREPVEEIKQLQLQLQYWEGVRRDARKGVYSMATITGGVIGAASQDDKIDRLFGSLLGAFIGKVADNWRQRTDLRNAELAIKNLKERIKILEEANKLIAKKPFLIRSGNRVKLSPVQEQQENIKLISDTLVTAKEYRALKIPTLGLSKQYKYLMGDVTPNFYGIITGESGHGKSTFAIDFANYLEKNHGRVVYMAAEQKGENKPLQDLLEKKKASFLVEKFPHKYDTKKWVKLSQNVNFVFIDSADALHLSPIQVEAIREEAPNTAFVVILQYTKDGKFKGSNEWRHNCDVFMKAKEMTIYQDKSRFGTPPTDLKIEPVE